MNQAPQPLTPPDCDLRGMRFMPLDVVRLLDSDLFALSTGDEFKAAVALWCKSWGQVPAASLPNDDRILAHLSGAKNWKKVKDMAMRGWVLCDDGRWYHPVVASEALDAMDRREDWQESNENKKTRQQRWRERCKALTQQLRDMGVTPPRGAKLETLEEMLVDAQASTQASTSPSTQRDAVDDVEIGKTGTGTETYKKEDTTTTPPPHAHAREKPPSSSSLPEKIPDDAPNRAVQLAVILRRGGACPNTHATSRGMAELVELEATDAEALAALETAKRQRQASGSAQAITVAYLVPIVRELRTTPPDKPAAKPRDDWYRFDAGIERKGREVGLRARAGESYNAYADRIRQALAQQVQGGQP